MAGDRTVKVTLKGDISDFNRAMLSGAASAKAFSKELDSGTDRATNLTQSILAIGPALVPVAAAGVPIIAGLSNQMAFAAAGAGTMVLAFGGVGDALKAANDYAIEPTTANLQKLSESLDKLGPAGQDFALFLQELRPKLQELQNVAQAGLFPGMEDGITSLMQLLPQAEGIVGTVASSIGELIAEAGDNLNDPRWREFFDFLEREARPTILDMGRTLGNLAEGFANLWMAFDPLADDFSSSFLQLSRDFAKWTDGLSETEGFQEFIAYIQENGPRAWDALAAIGDALLQIVEAAAPVGSAALPVITALAKVIGEVADSDLGPVIIGVISLTSALSRMKAIGIAANSSAMGGLFGNTAMGGGLSKIKAATAAAESLRVAQSKLADNPGMQGLTVYKENLKGVADAEKKLGAATRDRNRQFRSAGAGVAAMAFVMSDLDDKMGLTNTAMLAMAGSMAGPWGAGLGAGVGLVMDLASAGDDAAEKIKNLTAQVKASGPLSGTERHDISVTASALVDDKDSLRASEELDAALASNKRSADDARFAEAGLGKAMRDASNDTRQETLALLDNIRTKNMAADAAEGVFAAETNYRRALKDAQEQAKKTNAGIDGSSDAALKNRDMLDGLANAWNKQSDAGGKTRAEMRKAQAAFIRVAEDMGVSSKRARQLAEDLFHIPSPKPKVELTGDKVAIAAAKALKRALDAINPFKKVTIETHNTTVNDHGKTKAASGGYITGPGGPRDDAIPAMLSNGEFVINAAATSRNLALLHSINSQRYANGGPVGHVQRMADGGHARSGGLSLVSVSLVGQRARLVGPDLIEFTDGRIEAAISGQENFTAGQRRGRTR